MADSPALDAAVYRPLRHGNALEDAVARILQTIRLGVVAPGEALPAERELAQRFSVSRDTVRDAIRELADAGYLTARRGRYGGTFVADELPAVRVELAAGELDELIRLREVLETGAARAAAGRRGGAELAGHLARCRGAAPADYRRLDSLLHLAIAEAAGIPALLGLVAENRARVNALLDAFPLLPRNIEHSDRQHAAIVDAVLAGRPDTAESLMREHLDGSAALLRGFLA
jgi:DNA-binding FadR family transcriptional regulator